MDRLFITAEADDVDVALDDAAVSANVVDDDIDVDVWFVLCVVVC